MSTSRKTRLSGCTFSQKDFIQMTQVQISPYSGARPILTLVYQFLADQFYVSESRTIPLDLPFGGFTTTKNPLYKVGKHICVATTPNHFAILVPGMGLNNGT